MKLLVILILSSSLFAEVSLENKLDALNVPSDKVSPMITQDKIKILNTRYSSLINRHEITLAGANNFMADSLINTTQAFATYRYHINPKWSLGLRYSKYNNKLTDSGRELARTVSGSGNNDYAIESKELLVNYNALYGKVRWSSDKVIYFDQYFTLGYGKIERGDRFDNGIDPETDLITVDLGVSLWLGKNWSSRIGLKNELYEQQRANNETENVYNAMGYIEFGYLFGQGSRI